MTRPDCFPALDVIARYGIALQIVRAFALREIPQARRGAVYGMISRADCDVTQSAIRIAQGMADASRQGERWQMVDAMGFEGKRKHGWHSVIGEG